MTKLKRISAFMLSMVIVVGALAGCGDSASKPSTSPAEPSASPSKTAESDGTSVSASEAAEGDESSAAEAAVSDTYENGLSRTEKVVLNFGIHDAGVGTAYFDETLKLFQSLYPNVEVNVTKSADIQTVIQTKIAAGDDDDMFDLFNNPNNRDELIQAGVLETFDEMWDWEFHDTPGVKIRDLAVPTTVEFSYLSGWPDGEKHVAQFPCHGGNYAGLFFNKGLFEEKGWNMAPKTWEEFLDLCKTIKNDGTVPLVFTGVYSYYLDRSMSQLKAFELADEAGELDSFMESFRNYSGDYYTNEYNLATWDKISQLGKLGYFHTGMAGMTHTQAQMQVLQGNVAMVSTASFVGNEMASSTPEGFEWGFMVVPFREDESSTLYVRGGGNNGYVVWANKPDVNKAWCKEFIRLMCDMSIQEVIAESGNIPFIRTDYFEDQARVDKMQETCKAVIDFLNEKGSNYVVEDLGHFSFPTDPAFAQAQQLYSENYVDMALGTVDPEEVLTECQELLDKANAAR